MGPAAPRILKRLKVNVYVQYNVFKKKKKRRCLKLKVFVAVSFSKRDYDTVDTLHGNWLSNCQRHASAFICSQRYESLSHLFPLSSEYLHWLFFVCLGFFLAVFIIVCYLFYQEVQNLVFLVV